MKTDDLTFVAEALIALCDDRDECHERRQRPTLPLQERDEGRQLAQAFNRNGPENVLLSIECQEVYDNAKLTGPQASVFEMRLSGMTFDEIGRRRGHTKQAAQNIFVQAIKKFARALHVYPYAGLADIYRYETRRGLHARFGTMSR